jgi:hypothetical protein
MLRIEIVMNNNLPRKKRNIKRETRKKTKRNYSRKSSTQKKKVLHLRRRMKVIVNQKEYSLWPWKSERIS